MSTSIDHSPIYSERVYFDDGDHLVIGSHDSNVMLTGHLDGEDVDLTLDHRDAATQADLLLTYAPDALWDLPRDRMRRIGGALTGAAAEAAEADGVPWADSPEDTDRRGIADLAADPTVPSSTILDRLGELTGVPTDSPADSERIAMDDGHADVDVADQHVEVTVRLGTRTVLGLALSADEADRIGSALRSAAHRAHVAAAADVDLTGVETVTDLWHRAQESGTPAAALVDQLDAHSGS